MIDFFSIKNVHRAKMFVIFIFLFINVINSDKTDGKYIDLLPEREKNNFLDQIARRILEEVESSEKAKGSTELTEAQLNKHDEYVRHVLQEEAKNMRKHDKTDQESEKVIPLNKNTDGINGKTRRVFDGFVDDDNDNNDETQINDGTVQSDTEDIQVKNFRHSNDNDNFHDSDKVTESVPKVDDIPDVNTEQNTEKLELNSNLEDDVISNQKSSEKLDVENDKITDVKNIKVSDNLNEESDTILNNYKKVEDLEVKDNENDNYNKSIEKNDNSNVNLGEKEDHTEIVTKLSYNTESDTISNTEKTSNSPENKDTNSDVNNKSIEDKFDDNVQVTDNSEFNHTEYKESINDYKRENLGDKENREINKSKESELKTTTNYSDFYSDKDKISKERDTNSTENLNNDEIRRIEHSKVILSNISQETNEGNNNKINSEDGFHKNDKLEENQKAKSIIQVTTNIPFIYTTTEENQDIKDENINYFEKTLEIVKNSTNSFIKDVNMPNSTKLFEKLQENKSDHIDITEEREKRENIKNNEENKEVNNTNIEDIIKRNEDSEIINIKISTINNSYVDFTEKPYLLRNLDNDENFDHMKSKTESETTKQPKIELLTTVHVTNYINKEQNKIERKKNENNMKMDDIEILINKSISNLRNHLLNKNTQTDAKIKPFYETNNKKYIVYEIPANVPPFVKNTPKVKETQNTKEEPFNVPVYNYSPNNAFYNAHNMAPNHLEVDEKDANYESFSKNTESENGKDDRIQWDYYFSEFHRDLRFGSNLSNDNNNQPKEKARLTDKNDITNLKDIKDYDNIDNILNENVHLRALCDKCKTYVESEEDEIVQKGFVNNLKTIRQFLMEKQSLFVTPFWNGEKNVKKNQGNSQTTPKDVEINEQNDGNEAKPKERSDLTRSHLRTKEKSHYRLLNILNEKDPKYLYIMPSQSHIRKRALDNLVNKKCPNEDTFCALISGLKLDPKKTQNLKKDAKIKKEKIVEILVNNTKIKKDILRTVEKPTKNSTKEKHLEIENLNIENKKNSTDYEFMRKILSIVDSADVIPIFQKLTSLNRRKDNENIEKVVKDVNIYINVILDMVKTNNKALVQFNWLESAVNLQSALEKMNQMVDTIQREAEIHPSDFELLKYLIYIHKTAVEYLQLQKYDLSKVGTKSYLPRNKNKKRKYITEKGLIQNRPWLRGKISHQDLDGFQNFLYDLESALSNLHTTLKYISMVTKYKNQNWFKNLRELNDFGRKEALELLVHLFGTRILVLIEKSARNGLESDYVDFVRNNFVEVATMAKEFVFLLELLEELKYLE